MQTSQGALFWKPSTRQKQTSSLAAASWVLPEGCLQIEMLSVCRRLPVVCKWPLLIRSIDKQILRPSRWTDTPDWMHFALFQTNHSFCVGPLAQLQDVLHSSSIHCLPGSPPAGVWPALHEGHLHHPQGREVSPHSTTTPSHPTQPPHTLPNPCKKWVENTQSRFFLFCFFSGILPWIQMHQYCDFLFDWLFVKSR